MGSKSDDRVQSRGGEGREGGRQSRRPRDEGGGDPRDVATSQGAPRAPWGRARSPLDLGLLVPFPGVVSQVAAIRFSSRRRGACGQRLCCGEVRFHRAAERVW